MEETKRVIKLGEEASLVLKTVLFEDDIDMDRLTRVDVNNIYAEFVTIPVILNKVGIALADTTDKFNRAKLEVEIIENQLKEKFYTDASSAGEKLTEDKCNVKVRNNIKWQMAKKTMYSKQKDMDYVNSLYWALKTKNDKIDSMAKVVNPEDVIDFLSRTKILTFNHVKLKIAKSLE